MVYIRDYEVSSLRVYYDKLENTKADSENQA